MVRLPAVGQDDGKWGGILNEFLEVEHESDGKLKADGSLAGKADASHTHAQSDITDLTTDLNAITTDLNNKFGNDQDLIPAADDTYSVGSAQFRWKKMHTTQFDMVHKTGDGTHEVINQQGSVVAGTLNAKSGHTATIQTLAPGALAGGYATAYVDGYTEGVDSSYGGNDDVVITAGATGTNSYGVPLGAGSFVWGFVRPYGYTPGVVSSITATGQGAFATGYAKAGSITASRAGSFAAGHVNGFYSAGFITASGFGSFAMGQADAYNPLTASGNSSFAQGRGVVASGHGSFAQGILSVASGSSSFAQGNTAQAAANNSVQFGQGTNDLADSLKVGNAGLRLKGKSGAPASPVNGDIWIDGSGNVIVRSGGVNKNLSNIT